MKRLLVKISEGGGVVDSMAEELEGVWRNLKLTEKEWDYVEMDDLHGIMWKAKVGL